MLKETGDYFKDLKVTFTSSINGTSIFGSIYMYAYSKLIQFTLIYNLFLSDSSDSS